jgi:hypothetical protein
MLGHVGFVVDKVALGNVFSKYFGFPFQSSFHQLLHNHHHVIWGWYNRPIVATVRSGLSLTPPIIIIIIFIYLFVVYLTLLSVAQTIILW